MKRLSGAFGKRALLCFILFFVLAGMAYAQTWYPTNQVTIAWDAVTTLDDGSPIPSGQTVTYTIMTRVGTQDGPISEGSTIEAAQAVIGFTVHGRYLIGIRTNLMEGSLKLAESAISWSYDASVVQNGKTFGVIFSRLPSGARNLRILP